MKIIQTLAIAILFGLSACTTGTAPQEPLDHKTKSEKSAIKTADIYGVYWSAEALGDLIYLHLLSFHEDHTATEYLFIGNPRTKAGNIEMIDYFSWEFDEATNTMKQHVYESVSRNEKNVPEKKAEDRTDIVHLDGLKLGGDGIIMLKITGPDGKAEVFDRQEELQEKEMQKLLSELTAIKQKESAKPSGKKKKSAK
ncbi:MAG: hypothetical protein ACFNUL_07640 [Cardiobacterium hominis]